MGDSTRVIQMAGDTPEYNAIRAAQDDLNSAIAVAVMRDLRVTVDVLEDAHYGEHDQPLPVVTVRVWRELK